MGVAKRASQRDLALLQICERDALLFGWTRANHHHGAMRLDGADAIRQRALGAGTPEQDVRPYPSISQPVLGHVDPARRAMLTGECQPLRRHVADRDLASA